MANWPYNTAAWRALRKAKLAADPLCHGCKLRGILIPAQAVDHVVSISQGGDPFPPLDGLMSLCIRCHNEKTAALDRSRSKLFPRRFKGFGPDGNPIDPGDGWFDPTGAGANHSPARPGGHRGRGSKGPGP